ncbi:undecaprenyl-phosphate glucose phosphotransferase [Microbulbifer aestuariivivens]|uniref:undecaprenyl-phosphate glucose phosphotransferase n=1 Tax=Microbulbifer aestuariivivens TaxID=1908308 RepID=UPI0031EB6DE0
MAAVYRLLDGALILAALFISLAAYGHEITSDWFLLGLIAAIGFALLAESVDLYRSWRADTYLQMVAYTAFAWCVLCAVLLLVGYFTKTSGGYSRLVIGTWGAATLVLLCVWRFAFRHLLFFLRARGYNTRSAAIIGVTESGLRLARNLIAEPQLGIRVAGFYQVAESDACQASKLAGEQVRLLGSVEDAVAAARAGDIDLIYIALPMREEQRIVEILAALADSTATVQLLTDLFVSNLLHTRWHNVGDSSMLSVYDTPIEGLNGWLKRLEDVLLSSVILVLIAPLMLLIAAAVKLTSPGPVIFKQHRYGLDGRPIKVWKFRSMTTQDDGDKVVQASKGDARITPVGAFLRRTSLDELPQFINVLQGRMSIVGPRPHAVAHNEEYRQVVSGYMLRHKVKPGITGWAQVNGWRGETDTLEKMSKRVEHDLHYIRHWSLWLDIRIVLMTVFKGFTGKNAY